MPLRRRGADAAASSTERVNRFANGLLALGLKRGDRVAVMLPNHPDYVVAFLAAARIGVCQVPVNINLRGAGLAYVLEHSELRGLIVDARFATQVVPVLKPGMVEFIVGRGGIVGADVRPRRRLSTRCWQRGAADQAAGRHDSRATSS